MGKYSKKKKKNNRPLRIGLLIVLTLLLFVLIWVASLLSRNEIPTMGTADNQTEAQTQDTTDTHVQKPTEAQTQRETEAPPQVQTQEAISLGQGLVIEGVSNYAGIYMEDGSDQIVTDVMMILVRNTSDQDIQFARIHMVYDSFEAQFEVSNLPAGDACVLLEKNRASMPDTAFESAELKNVAFFKEPMNLQTDRLEITGGKGYLEVKNISQEDFTGIVRIFYKNSSQDLFYGGITYVATLEGGLAVGETYRILTGHYSEGNSRIVHVTCGE